MSEVLNFEGDEETDYYKNKRNCKNSKAMNQGIETSKTEEIISNIEYSNFNKRQFDQNLIYN